MRRLFIVIMLALAVGCSSDEPPDFVKQNNEAPKHSASTEQRSKKANSVAAQRQSPDETSLTLEPADATKNTILKVKAKGFSIKDAQIVWLLNGVPTSTPRMEYFDSPELSIIKGDSIQAKVVKDGTEFLSNIVTIVNAKPEIENVNYVIPDTLEASKMLSVDVTVKDEDDDPVTLIYKWQKNGIPAGEGRAIEMELKRGDEFAVAITPFDGEEYGREAVIKRTMGNFPPRIAQQFSFTYESGTYKYQVQADDLDGDAITYVLKSGPEGMVIDSSSGLVTWKAPEDFKGTAPFTVAATDGQGGETQMEMSLVVEGQAKPTK